MWPECGQSLSVQLTRCTAPSSRKGGQVEETELGMQETEVTEVRDVGWGEWPLIRESRKEGLSPPYSHSFLPASHLGVLLHRKTKQRDHQLNIKSVKWEEQFDNHFLKSSETVQVWNSEPDRPGSQFGFHHFIAVLSWQSPSLNENTIKFEELLVGL